MVRGGKYAARELTRARSLLKADGGLRDEDRAEAVETSVAARERVRKRFGAVGLGTLTKRPRPGRRAVLTAKGQAPVCRSVQHSTRGAGAPVPIPVHGRAAVQEQEEQLSRWG
jgi:hypothetical protein